MHLIRAQTMFHGCLVGAHMCREHKECGLVSRDKCRDLSTWVECQADEGAMSSRDEGYLFWTSVYPCWDSLVHEGSGKVGCLFFLYCGSVIFFCCQVPA